MSVKARHHLVGDKDLAKKPRKSIVATEAPFVLMVRSVFKGKSAVISHGRLRDLTLRSHQGKPYRLPHASHHVAAHQRHSVELTDDIIVVDRHGHRVLPPGYATLRIDQLSLLKKG